MPGRHSTISQMSGIPARGDGYLTNMKKEVKNANIMPVDELRRQLRHHEYVLETKMVESVWDPNKEVPAHANDLEHSYEMCMSLSARINAIDKSNTPQASS